MYSLPRGLIYERKTSRQLEQRYDKASLSEDRTEMSVEVKNVMDGHKNERLEKEGRGTIEAGQKAVEKAG